MSFLPDSVRWYALLLIVTWAFAPLARILAGRLPDRGAFVAKPVGLLATVWPLWFLVSATPLPFGAAGLWTTVALSALVGWGILARRGAIDRSWITHLAVAELIALLAFAGYLGVRGFTPDTTGTEKPMDIAFLTSSSVATEMPPHDPWMAGEPINYYYFGYLMNGSLARLSATPTPVGFNLALASTFAMTLTAAAGLGYGIVRGRVGRRAAVAAGSLTAFLVTIAGNLRAPVDFLRDPTRAWETFWWQNSGWLASRVVEDTDPLTGDPAMTINEFPSFSFILGDLHPHVMALPITIVSLVIAVNLFHREPHGEGSQGFLRFAPLVAGGAIIGALYPLNSWDYPTYLAAAILALLVSLGLNRQVLYRVAALGLASVVAWAPFWITFVPFAGGGERSSSLPLVGRLTSTIGAYRGERTSAGEFFTIFGMPWVVAVLFLGLLLARQRQPETPLRIPKSIAASGLMLAAIALGLPAPVIILAGLPLAAALYLLVDAVKAHDTEVTLALALFAAGFGLILVTEFFYIQDVFSGRLNTLFKVYYQVWTLFGVAAALSLVHLWNAARQHRATSSLLALGITAIVLCGVAYPVLSFKTWIETRPVQAWTGLDGAAYVGVEAPDDLATIKWLVANRKENDVLLEGPGCSYTVNFGVPTGRLAAYSGVPNVIGWTGHERQWRGGQPDLKAEIAEREAAAQQLYADPLNIELLDRYGVTLLYVGKFEREGADRCEPAGPFAEVTDPAYPGPGWTEVFASGDSRLYRRTPT
jgi:YYY domain-containing protein